MDGGMVALGIVAHKTFTMGWIESDGPLVLRRSGVGVRHHGYGTDGGAQRGCYGGP